MKKIITLLLSTVLILALVACKDKATKNETTTKLQKIVVGTNAEFAPFEYLDKDQIVGFDIDLINEIAKEMNVEIEIKDMAFDGLIPALQAKKVDLVIAGMTNTEERAKTVAFSDTYYTSKQVVIVKKGVEIKSFDDLVGKKVGVMLGFTSDTLMTEKEGVNVERFPAAYAAIMALNQDKLDAVVLDQEPAKHYIVNNENLIIADVPAEEENSAIAAIKWNTELIEEVNKALAKVKASGKYDELIKKYF